MNCLFCGKVLFRDKRESFKNYNRRKFCNRFCFDNSGLGRFKGFHHTKESKDKIRNGNFGKRRVIKIFDKKYCPTCGKLLIMRYREGNFAFEKRKYCNRFCYDINPDVIKKRRNATLGRNWELTKATKEKISLSKMSEKNPQWKGNEPIAYNTVHSWVRNHKPKPEVCECCKLKKPYDLANISGKYKRDINDFEWLCRKCHMVKDGRIYNLKYLQRLKNNCNA